MFTIRVACLLVLCSSSLWGQERGHQPKPDVEYPDVIVVGKVKKIRYIQLERILPEPGGRPLYIASFGVDLEVTDVEKGDAVKKGDVIVARARWMSISPMEWSLDLGSSLRAERVQGKGGLVWVIPRDLKDLVELVPPGASSSR